MQYEFPDKLITKTPSHPFPKKGAFKMEILVSLLIGLGCLFLFADTAEAQFESDVLATSAGDVTMTFLGHGTLMLTFNGKIIHVDPFSHVADFTKLPKADLILITHEHPDHLDLKALAPIRKDDTIVGADQKPAPVSLRGASSWKTVMCNRFSASKLRLFQLTIWFINARTAALIIPKAPAMGIF